MTSRTVRCVVAGPRGGTDLEEILSGLDATVVDVAFGPSPIATVRGASFVVAFLDRDVPSTLVDVGIAVALKKPLLLVAAEARDIPDRLLGFPWLLTQGLTHSDLALQIRGFASAFVPKQTASPASGELPRLDAERIVPVAPRRRTELRPRRFERPLRREQFDSEPEFAVAETLSRAGATVVPQARDTSASYIPDMAASFPELGPSFSTVLIEVSPQRLMASKMRALRRDLRDALNERGLQLGILVTVEEVEDAESEPGLLILSMQRLTELVDSGRLLPTLKQARNRVVHEAG